MVSGSSLGNQWSESVALGDFDLDGDLDVFVVNESSHPTTGSVLALQGESDEIWINDGIGNFTKSTQALASSNGEEVALGDVDGDGDIDALVGNRDSGSDLHLNDGTGLFSLHQILGTRGHNHVDLGDIDGDGDLDAIGVGIWVNRDRYKLFLPAVTN